MQDLENAGLRVRGGRGVVRPAGEEGAGPVPAVVRAARATASTSRPTRDGTPVDRGDGEGPRRRARSSTRSSEGDGPVNALDGALRKALLPCYPRLGGDAAGRLQGARRQRRGRAPPPACASSSSRATATDVWGTVGVSENIIEASLAGAGRTASSTSCSRTQRKQLTTEAQRRRDDREERIAFIC